MKAFICKHAWQDVDGELHLEDEPVVCSKIRFLNLSSGLDAGDQLDDLLGFGGGRESPVF